MTKLCIFQIDISNKTWYNVQEISNMLEKTVNKDKNSCLRIPEFGAADNFRRKKSWQF